MLFTLVFLPYDAYVSLDAIARTAVRVLWSKRNLLEWKTSSDAQRAARSDLTGFFRSMWFAPAVAERFRDKAERIAESLKLALFYRPGSSRLLA